MLRIKTGDLLSYTFQPPYEHPREPDSGKLCMLINAPWYDSVKSSMIDSRFAHLPEWPGITADSAAPPLALCGIFKPSAVVTV